MITPARIKQMNKEDAVILAQEGISPTKTYTVIGYYESSGQSFAESYEAADGMGAMRLCALAHRDLTLVCAVRGDHKEGPGMEFAGEGVVDAETFLEIFNEEGE